MHSGAGRWVEAAECFSQAINHSKERADVAVQLAAHLGAGVALAQQVGSSACESFNSRPVCIRLWCFETSQNISFISSCLYTPVVF
ncbi:unnamed protein product [Closterium sp. Yama58-4]|nr:unnamed protein product [Closterium sp. Yama58-4]